MIYSRPLPKSLFPKLSHLLIIFSATIVKGIIMWLLIVGSLSKTKPQKDKPKRQLWLLPLINLLLSLLSRSKPLCATDIEAYLHQVLSNSFTALSVTLGKNSCFISSACYNHMTLPHLYSSRKSPNPKSYIAYGSHMPISHSGIATSSVNVGNTYLLPKLSLKFISISQVCELDLRWNFLTRFWCANP